MKIHFLPDQITIEAEAGEPLLDVAKRAGVVIPTDACEVEIDEDNFICACISAVPPEKTEMTINIYSDPTW